MFNPIQTIEDPGSNRPVWGETKFSLPRYSLLEGFTEFSTATEGIDPSDLFVRDSIHLRTVNSEYRIVLLEPAMRRVVVQGGRLFPGPTEATIRGSSCGGAMLRVGWIGVGLQLEIIYHPARDQALSVITSPVERLYLERAGR